MCERHMSSLRQLTWDCQAHSSSISIDHQGLSIPHDSLCETTSLTNTPFTLASLDVWDTFHLTSWAYVRLPGSLVPKHKSHQTSITNDRQHITWSLSQCRNPSFTPMTSFTHLSCSSSSSSNESLSNDCRGSCELDGLSGWWCETASLLREILSLNDLRGSHWIMRPPVSFQRFSISMISEDLRRSQRISEDLREPQMISDDFDDFRGFQRIWSHPFPACHFRCVVVWS